MAVNEFGNDTKNNIMWNKEYPWVSELVNDKGEVFHENDPVFLSLGEGYDDPKYNNITQGRIHKMYSNDYVIVYIKKRDRKAPFSWYTCPLSDLQHHYEKNIVPLADFDGWDWYNVFQCFLNEIYLKIYGSDILDDSPRYHEIWNKDLERIHQSK